MSVRQLIGLHRRHVDIGYLEQMAKAIESVPERQLIDECFVALERGGLLQHHGQGIYRMHPALSGFLAQRYPATSEIQRGFVDVMGTLVDHLTPKEWHEQRD